MPQKVRELGKQLAIYGAGDVAVSAVNLLLLPIYVEYLSERDYGVLGLLGAVTAAALGFEVARDTTTGVLTITGRGHQVLVGPGTAQVPVDSRVVEIKPPARAIGGMLYAPAEFLEKDL